MLPDAPGARRWWAPACWPHHARCVLRPHRACFVTEASLESSCSHLRYRVCSRVCCPGVGDWWAPSGRGWRKARWRLAHPASNRPVARSVPPGSAACCLPPCRRCGALHFTPTPRWTRWSGCLARLAAPLPLGAAPPPHHQALVLRTLTALPPRGPNRPPKPCSGTSPCHLLPEAHLALIML